MPAEKDVAARRQTRHKLETMGRYWRVWCRILAQADDKGFCNRRLFLIDSMAGRGLHESQLSPDGAVAGTPLQAVLAARATQGEFPEVAIRVRASEIKRELATRLGAIVGPYRGPPPGGVDVRVDPIDWVEAAPRILSEIRSTLDHRHQQGLQRHDHRSLWFIDPFGLEPIDRSVIERLPYGAEVIVNFDENTARRHAGRDLGYLTERVYGDDRWREAIAKPLGGFAEVFAESFARFKFRNIRPLRASGAQDRFFVHLTNSKAAVGAFERCVAAGLKAGTLIAGDLLTGDQKHDAAIALAEVWKTQTVSLDEMYASGAGRTRVQLRGICEVAHDLGYGRWNARARTIEWFPQRLPEPTLGL